MLLVAVMTQTRCKYCGRENITEPLRDSIARFCWRCVLRRLFPYFTGLHRRILTWFYVGFASLTLLLVLPGAISGHGEPFSTSMWGVLFAFAGPFTGMASRGFNASYGTPSLVPYCCAALAGGLLFQLIPLRLGRVERGTRLFAWCVGWLGWFAGSLLSTLVANS